MVNYNTSKMISKLIHVSVFLILVVMMVFGDYVTYIKTEDNKFEPGEC